MYSDRRLSDAELANTLAYIRGYITRAGIPPTRREIMTGLGLSSTSLVVLRLAHLKRLGLITLREGTARGILPTHAGWEWRLHNNRTMDNAP